MQSGQLQHCRCHRCRHPPAPLLLLLPPPPPPPPTPPNSHLWVPSGWVGRRDGYMMTFLVLRQFPSPSSYATYSFFNSSSELVIQKGPETIEYPEFLPILFRFLKYVSLLGNLIYLRSFSHHILSSILWKGSGFFPPSHYAILLGFPVLLFSCAYFSSLPEPIGNLTSNESKELITELEIFFKHPQKDSQHYRHLKQFIKETRESSTIIPSFLQEFQRMLQIIDNDLTMILCNMVM